MARRRKGQPVHGWVVLDKPYGMTSTQAVGKVRRAFDAQKAGHAGTLDPLATGILPIALGEATKTIPYLVEARKTYLFTIRWGVARSTDDAEGVVTATSDKRPSRAEIEAVLAKFIGLIDQIPPAFSAIKVEGERAYDLARAGAPPELAARPIEILSLELLATPQPELAEFRCRTGKGAYIRSLARDLAHELGTQGHVAALRRTAVGPFGEAQAISLESLTALGHSPAASGQIYPVETALDDIPALALTDAEALRLRSGQTVGLLKASDRARLGRIQNGDLVLATHGDKPLAIARLDQAALRTVRLLNI